VEELVRTGHGLVAFARRDGRSVVLKVVERHDGERHAGEALEAFGGRGVARALEHGDGVVLLERMLPGRRLSDEDIEDEEATGIIAGVIGRMSPDTPPKTAPTVEAWGEGFERSPMAGTVVDEARRTYERLRASQGETRLLHGDLHHGNVLRDAEQGWMAIDPKGVVGEPAYELGAALRNPSDRPEVFAAPAVIRARVDCFARALQLDPARILGWAFAQAVLAAIWELEDDGALRAGTGWLAFAESARRMLDADVER
jgi:streptomycin 6-kinase